MIFAGAPTGTLLQFETNIIHYNEIELKGSEWIVVGGFVDVKMVHAALEMIRTRKAPAADLITHRYSLQYLVQALITSEKRSHEALGGKAASKSVGIQVEGENKRLTLIQNGQNCKFLRVKGF